MLERPSRGVLVDGGPHNGALGDPAPRGGHEIPDGCVACAVPAGDLLTLPARPRRRASPRGSGDGAELGNSRGPPRSRSRHLVIPVGSFDDVRRDPSGLVTSRGEPPCVHSSARESVPLATRARLWWRRGHLCTGSQWSTYRTADRGAIDTAGRRVPKALIKVCSTR
jgi:hypothetical protein